MPENKPLLPQEKIDEANAKAAKIAVFIEGVAKGADLSLTWAALEFSKEAHKDQRRDDGTNYINHLVSVCIYLIDHGVRDDVILAAALLHDSMEDQPITVDAIEARFGHDVTHLANLLTKSSSFKGDEYFRHLATDPRAVLIKAADRACNIRDMVGVFTMERMKRYILETEDYVMPMLKKCRQMSLPFNDAMMGLYFHIRDTIKIAKALIEEIEKLCPPK